MKKLFYVIARSVFQRRSNLKRLLHSLRSFAMTFIVLSFNGCTIIKHMDELSSMGDFARDKADQQKEVDRVKANFDDLLKAIHSDQIKFYPDQLSIRSKFGLPITIKTVQDDGRVLEQWLYRYAIIKEAKDRVYIYFDENKKVIKVQEEKIQWL